MTFTIQGSASGIVFRGPTADEDTLTMTSVARDEVLSSGVDSQVTVDDVVFDRHTSASVRHEFDIVANGGENITYTALNPSIATVDANGKTTRVSDGVAGFVAAWRLGGRRLDLDHSDTGGETQDVFSDWASGSLAEDVNDAVDTRLAVGGDKTIFTTQNHAAATYVRNTSCWAADLDLTGISPWNSYGGNKRAGTLISPRHIIFADHYSITNGSTVRFVKADNTVVDMTLSSQVQVGVTDIKIGLLNADVPAGVTFYKLPPADILTGGYLPHLETLGVPGLRLDQEEKATVADWYAVESNYNRMKVPSDVTRLSYYEDIILYDSGNPAFLIIDDEPVLLTTWHYGVAGSGPAVQDYITEINAAMATLGGGYTATTKSLSGYPTY